MRCRIDKIKAMNQAAGGHYFDEDTLEGFNQRLSDFKVFEYKGRLFTYAQSRGYELMGEKIRPWSVTEIDLDTGRTRSVGIRFEITQNPETTAEDIEAAIRSIVDGGE